MNKEPEYPSTDAPVGFDGPSTSVAASDPMGIQQPLPAGEAGPDGRRLPPGVAGAGVGGPGGDEGDGEMALGPDGEQLGPDGQPLPPDQYGDTDPSALSDFRETLNPYGQWVDDPTYGTLWVPSSNVVGSDFTPYETAGQWGYDNGSYTWMSDYAWGWAPFHYGRWAYTGGYGWGWIPGRTYSGAWVSWRTGGPGYGYVGWAPMGPTWGWRNGAAVGFGFASRAPYAFCPTERLFSPGVSNSVVRGPQVAGIASSTRPYTASAPAAHTVAHPTVNAGPSPSSLGISAQAVAHPSANSTASAQLARAQAFSRPSTAVAAGAHAPTINGAARVASSYRGNGGNTYGRVGTSAYSSAHSPVATSQQYRGVSPSPYRSVGSSYARTSGVTRIGGGSSYSYGGSNYNSMYSGRSSFSTPSYHTPFVAHATGTTTPTVTTMPGYNTTGVSRGGGGGFHSSGFSHGGGGGGGHGHR